MSANVTHHWFGRVNSPIESDPAAGSNACDCSVTLDIRCRSRLLLNQRPRKVPARRIGKPGENQEYPKFDWKNVRVSTTPKLRDFRRVVKASSGHVIGMSNGSNAVGQDYAPRIISPFQIDAHPRPDCRNWMVSARCDVAHRATSRSNPEAPSF